jgi:polyisoprenoid-binding protein YceI
MKTTTPIVALLAPLVLIGCGTADDSQPQADAAAASPSDVPAGGADVSVDNIPAGVYSVDRNHTYLTFSYLHLGYTYPQLRFTGIDGQLMVRSESMEDSSVAIAIDTASLDTKLPRFNTELQSLQYFNARDYPKIAFTSHSYEAAGPRNGALTGYLTIKGRTRPVKLDVTLNNAIQHPMMNVPAIGFSATGTVLRSDWGLSRNIPFVADEVDIRIEIEFLQGSNESSTEAAAIAAETTASAPEESLILSRAEQ